jgi:hypothetical protein
VEKTEGKDAVCSEWLGCVLTIQLLPCFYSQYRAERLISKAMREAVVMLGFMVASGAFVGRFLEIWKAQANRGIGLRRNVPECL